MQKLIFILFLLFIPVGSFNVESRTVSDSEKIIDLQIRVSVLEVKLTERDKALEIAKEALVAYQISNNEWRNENIDQRALFPTKEDVDGKMNGLEYRISVLEKAGNTFIGTQSTKTSVWSNTMTLIFILIALTSVIINIIQFSRNRKA